MNKIKVEFRNSKGQFVSKEKGWEYLIVKGQDTLAKEHISKTEKFCIENEIPFTMVVGFQIERS